MHIGNTDVFKYCSERAIMRYEGEINTAQKWKSICRATLLNDNAPDSELPLFAWFEFSWGAAIFDILHVPTYYVHETTNNYQ